MDGTSGISATSATSGARRRVDAEDGHRAAGTHDGDAIRVLIVDDHRMITQALARIVDAEPDLVAVAEVADVDDAVQRCEELRPDVVLMDVGLPSGDGITCAATLKTLPTPPRVLVLTGSGAVEHLTRAVREGCDGLLLKTASAEELTRSIRAVNRGEVAFSTEDLARVMRTAGAPTSTFDLSERERQVLLCLAEGRSTADIGATLFISVHTVRSHVRHILEKLGAHSKLEAVVLARRAQLVP